VIGTPIRITVGDTVRDVAASEMIFAPGGLPILARRLRELGATRVLVVCGASRRFVDGAVAALGELSPVVFDGARVHVPAEVVDRAAAALRESGADAIVAIGGGSAIGLGKALRLLPDVYAVKVFAAVPTTYAGSERTAMYGITRAHDKQTGRDAKVVPDLVLYDVQLAREMPIALTAQSLLNAVAHVASAGASLGSGGSGGDDDDARRAAYAAAHATLRALEDLLFYPRAIAPRDRAARAASECAAAFDQGKPGAQHALAHLLGGALGLDHAALHAVLLPHFLAHLRATSPHQLHELETALDRRDLDAYVHDLLVRAGAPVSLAALGASADTVHAALATRPELPAAIARDALHGLRPPGRGGRVALGEAEGVVLGPDPAHAKRIVLALHGRGAEAGTIARRYREIVAHDPATCVVGLRADGGADRWYAVRYGDAGAGRDAEVVRALARVDTARRVLAQLAPAAAITLAGFSQGACLALEYAARHGAGLAAVIAPCGARIGRPDEWPAPQRESASAPVLLGAASGDKWIAGADLDATAAWFAAAGACVELVAGTGDAHEITARQRLVARELVLGPQPRGAPAGVHESAARPGAVPAHQNSPRVAPLGLYPEQLNGTPFTTPRATNQRTWTYRVRPSAQRRRFAPLPHAHVTASFDTAPLAELAGFCPLAVPEAGAGADFVDGLVTLCGAGDARLRRGFAFHRYAANRSMNHRALYSGDGDLLILPELGALTLLTELGPLEVAPGALAVIPRGVVFSVLLHGEAARGYVAEPFGRHFQLPERGPIGANGLTDARHLRAPHAWFEDRLAPQFRIVAKLGGALHEATQDHSPFDVVGWHGNYQPFVYDLDAFSPVGNSVFDHGDPSSYTVLSAPLDEPGANTLDLVVFRPRWDVAAHTFRPPFFHRNAVTEINGILIDSADGAFRPGCAFLTPPFTGHGVSGHVVERMRALSDAAADAPVHLHGTLWFQLETSFAASLAPWISPVDDWRATWGTHRGYFE
jgi:homogentisate 1,2-dioxygenase